MAHEETQREYGMGKVKQNAIRRRDLIRGMAAAVAAPFVLRHEYRVFADSEKTYPERAVRLVRESVVIDMLNQFLYRMDKKKILEDWLARPGAFRQVDFELFLNSGVNAINFGEGTWSLAEAEKLFAKWNSFIAEYPQWLMRINGADDFERAKSSGRFGIIYGLQTSAQFETDEA